MLPDDISLTQQQVRAAQDGDREALEALFARYLPRVRRLVASRMGHTARDFADREDLVQETLKDAVEGMGRFELRSPGAFCNWLARCVENNLVDKIRHGKRQKRGAGAVAQFADLGESFLAESVFAGMEPTPSQHVRGAELEQRIEEAMLRLRNRHREVINLRIYCEMSFAEIAEAMGLRNENTANVLFLRARDRLAALLGT